jgi:hypothetical protein
MKRFIFLLFFVSVSALPIQVMAQELVLYYPFEGAGKTVTDQSGKDNEGKFDTGSDNRVASKDKRFGMAMEFDAKSRITVPESDSLTIDTDISFVMWVNKADEAGGVGTLPRIISRVGDVHELAMDSGHITRGNFAIYFGGIIGWTGEMPVKEKEWHHIALTHDGAAFKIYLDGKLENEHKNGAKKTFAGPLYVGSRHDLGSNEYYGGLLDELALYADVLDEKTINQIMEEGVQGQFAVESAGKLALTWGSIKTR